MKHLLQVLAVVTLLFAGYTAKAQMSYGGEPYSFKNTISQVVPTVEIEAVDAEALLAEDAAIPGKDHALRIGVTKDVNYSIANSGRMDILPDGARVWRIAFHLKDATFTSMNFSKFNIPDGAELYLYTPDREFVIGKFINKNLMEDGTFYPQEVPGEEVVVEYYEPANVAFQGELVINQLSQGYYDFFHIKEIEGGIGNAEGNCHPNAICYDATWHPQINSVACYTMTAGGYVYMCSGSMINNTANNNKQYFLSANHCYTANATYKFYFLYQANTCNGTFASTSKTATGATVKAQDNANSSSDFMLLEITGGINTTYDVYLAGWDCSGTLPTNPTSCAAIHHPGGDMKKFSIPQTLRNGAMVYSNMSKYWITTWAYETGTTEQGSSGSALFNKDKLIVGQLYAGSSSCVATSEQGHEGPGGEDFYGKLSNSWTNGNNSNNAKKLKPWLDPNNTGATTLQGRWMNGAPSGLSAANTAANLNVYPNPTSGLVTISGSFNEGEGVCNVYDMMGNFVTSKSLNLNAETTLNLSNLTPGMYLLEISDNSNVYRSKILISK
ncbi:MAG: T9SS type A sorting domain-containing protein [Bacteroidales bacterium]|nr:T9SS type A sorting domain-containing protein [Bacteroidales bacterium]